MYPGKFSKTREALGIFSFLCRGRKKRISVASNDPVDIPMCVVGFHGIHGYSTDTLKLPRNVLF